MVAEVAQRWPELLELLGDRPPLVLNGYPAATGDYSFGVQVDSYLSLPVARRALGLAREEGMCAIVLAQPLWLADLVVTVTAPEVDAVLPERMIAATGGYPLPASLERFLEDACRAGGCDLRILQLYGVAELDAACLLGRARDECGRTVFVPRADIAVSVVDGGLHLARRFEEGWSEPVGTGDRCLPVGGDLGDGLVLLHGSRVLTEPWAVLESWDAEGWRRHTGYLRRADDGLRAQTRKGVVPGVGAPDGPVAWRGEDHHDFARATGASYLVKPDWRCDR